MDVYKHTVIPILMYTPVIVVHKMIRIKFYTLTELSYEPIKDWGVKDKADDMTSGEPHRRHRRKQGSFVR